MGDDVRLRIGDDLEDQNLMFDSAHHSTNLMSTATNIDRTSTSSRLSTLFRPSYLSSHGPPKLHATSYLDGLRGIAAFIVYIAHSEAWSHEVDELQYGFGYKDRYAFITLPFIRVFITGGHAAVAIFFVISGYVLSKRPLGLIFAQSEQVYPVLASAVFRRAIRLYFPFIAVTILVFTSWHVFGLQLEWPKPQPTYLGEVVHWWHELVLFVNPFRVPDDAWFSYDFPLWTIPVEFQGSLLVFTLLLTLSRTTRRARISLAGGLALYFLYIGTWQMFCFITGLLLADMDVHLNNNSGKGTGKNDKHSDSAVSVAVFAVGMYLASQPSLKDISTASESPGYGLLTALVPNTYVTSQWWRFWLALAAPMIVYSVARVTILKRLLESRLAQYLGKISFALYLVHIPVANTLGDIVFRVFGYVRPMTLPSAWDGLVSIPKIGPLGMELDFLVPQMVILPITLYLSELATRLFDEPSVTIGKQFYESVKAW